MQLTVVGGGLVILLLELNTEKLGWDRHSYLLLILFEFNSVSFLPVILFCLFLLFDVETYFELIFDQIFSLCESAHKLDPLLFSQFAYFCLLHHTG